MKKHWLVLGGPLAALLLTAWHRPGQDPMLDPDLRRVQREVWEVFFAGDTARLRALTPGLITINGGGSTFSNQEEVVRASAQFHAAGGRLIELSFPAMRAQRFGDVVIVYSTYRTVTTMGRDTTRQGGRATEVFVRQNGAWVNPGWHLDRMP